MRISINTGDEILFIEEEEYNRHKEFYDNLKANKDG